MSAANLSTITQKQRAVLEFLKSFIAENGYPPTLCEIAKHFNFRSLNAAESHLSSLKKYGFISQKPGIARGIKILNHHIEEARAMVVPEGWQLVPKTITDNMAEAIAYQAHCCGGVALDIYEALLAAAPKPECEG